MEIPILKDIVILTAASVPISIILTRLGLPTIVGFLVTGVVIGPGGLGLVTEHHEVEVLAEIGIVLLLFTIGIEFSINRMMSVKKEAFVGGGLQILMTFSLGFGSALLFGLTIPVAVLIGFILSLSSSAIVLALLTKRGEVSSTHGNLYVAILLFQDLCVVLMVMVVQSFGGGDASIGVIVKDLAIAAVAISVIIVTVAYLSPKLFLEVVKLQNREVFILTVVLVSIGTAYLSSLAGISLALGAFIAGLVISESEYAHQIVAEVLPFRDIFTSLFFMSIGMLVDPVYFTSNLPMILLLTAIVLLAKGGILVIIGQILKYPLRITLMLGLSLGQIGEFSFILLKMGSDFEILSNDVYQSLLAVSIITMALTPTLMEKASQMAFRIAQLFGKKRGHDITCIDTPKNKFSNHVIIVGFGLNGQNLARVLRETGIQFLIVDVSTERVQKAKAAGYKAFFGDVCHHEILKALSVEDAKMLVLTVSDPVSSRRIVKTAISLNPLLKVIVRTRYITEVEDLQKLGASQVIPEEFETSVEIFSRVLKNYNIPGNIIQNQIDLIRGEGYAMLRNPSLKGEIVANLHAILERNLMETFFIDEGSTADGMLLGNLDLKRKTNTTVMAVLRSGSATTNPPVDYSLEAGDMLVLIGNHAGLHEALKILKGNVAEL